LWEIFIQPMNILVLEIIVCFNLNFISAMYWYVFCWYFAFLYIKKCLKMAEGKTVTVTRRRADNASTSVNSDEISTCLCCLKITFLYQCQNVCVDNTLHEYTAVQIDLIWFIVFNATFSNISAISWRPVLVVEEAGVPGENHWPWASNWYTFSLAAASRVHPLCNLQSQTRTHAVLVIGLHELLDNPTA